MKTTFSIDDISRETARRAYYNVSFDPDKRGDSERQEYLNTCNMMLEIVESNATTDLQREKADEFLRGYKTRLTSLWNAYLSAKSRCMSSMITGSANFPVRRAEKANNSEHNRSVELIEFIEKSRALLRKIIEQNKSSEMVLDEAQQGVKFQVADLASFLSKPGFYSVALFRSNFRGRMLTIAKNNPALVDFIITEIKASPVKIFTDTNKFWGELEALKAKAQGKIENPKENKVIEVNCIEIIINYETDRIQIAFQGKPERKTIDQLKHKAFHWSPSTMTWMRKITQQALWAAKEICQGV